ncbi:prepilin-type N-terminal cleavage/methylation domain-containing protein [Candidatus Sumerlaeota bacterium]|nr:prepilin-type N-terminal cleavage/methylation domain-containing protein [Candidatus Sumerlaeota bacterium]
MKPYHADKPTVAGPGRRGRGFTLTEMMVAVAVSALVISGVLSVGLFVRKVYKATASQQLALYNAKKAIEVLNREIRRAQAPLLNLNGWGNRVEFRRFGESTVRSLELVSSDDDVTTPWDNSLVYDPNTATSGDEVTIAENIAASTAQGAFNYASGNRPLVVRMRAGDPVDDEARQLTGPGVQGVEINITVGPRN